jgi:hypothetical protein
MIEHFNDQIVKLQQKLVIQTNELFQMEQLKKKKEKHGELKNKAEFQNTVDEFK